MIAFIDDHRTAYGVEPICRVLPIAPSTYHAHAAKRANPGKLSARARRDASLQTDIKRVWDANFHVYGVRKVLRQLQREAITLPGCQADEALGAGPCGARQNGEDHAQRQIHPVLADFCERNVTAFLCRPLMRIRTLVGWFGALCQARCPIQPTDVARRMFRLHCDPSRNAMA
jgi:hypothetical protein